MKVYYIHLALYQFRVLETAIYNNEWLEQKMWYFLILAAMEGELE